MKTSLMLICISFFIGCAANSNVPEWERITNKFDGRWEVNDPNVPSFYMYFDIKYGKIRGKMGSSSWPQGIHLPIRGTVSEEGDFDFEYAGSLDVTKGFEIEVKEASAERGYIKGYAIDDSNKYYSWTALRK